MACLILQKIHEAPNFLRQHLTTDEAGFTRDAVFDNHNTHVWCDENPHQVGDRLIGPHIIPPRLNGAAYLDFLQNVLNELLEDVPLATRRDMWYYRGQNTLVVTF
jgi:hypothetical protein